MHPIAEISAAHEAGGSGWIIEKTNFAIRPSAAYPAMLHPDWIKMSYSG